MNVWKIALCGLVAFYSFLSLTADWPRAANKIGCAAINRWKLVVTFLVMFFSGNLFIGAVEPQSDFSGLIGPTVVVFAIAAFFAFQELRKLIPHAKSLK